MPSHTPAVLEDEQGRFVLRLERLLPHPPERVWEAITAGADLQRWHPTPFEFDALVGGQVRYLPHPTAPAMPPGTVTEYDPPRVFAYTWGEDSLRFECRPEPDGCRLTLSHSFEDRYKAARDAAGWELCLRSLQATLRGDPPPAAPEERIPPGWRELNSEYERRFGIPHERATPPPAG